MTTSEHSPAGLEAVDTTVGIVDGRVAMNAEDDAKVWVDTPDVEPLARSQRFASVCASGDGFRVSIDLTAQQRDDLASALSDDADADADTAGVDATQSFVWNCRDCGFVGTWLTTDGTCPECGGRDLPTEPREADR